MAAMAQSRKRLELEEMGREAHTTVQTLWWQSARGGWGLSKTGEWDTVPSRENNQFR